MSTGGDDQSQNSNSSSTPINVTSVYPFWNVTSNPNNQHHDFPSQCDYTNAYTNMSFFPPSMTIPPFNNMYYPAHNMNPQPSPQPIPQPTPQPTHQPPPQSTPSYVTRKGNKNWTMVADLQLTIAWCKIMTDPSVGVGQKSGTLWEKVLRLFKQLMQNNPGRQPEDFMRNEKACENRMGEIKGKCSIWSGVRAHCLRTYKSGWSSQDMEKLCLDQYLNKVKKQFKMMECWEVLKDHPKWHEFISVNEEKEENTTQPKITPRSKRATPSSEPEVRDSRPNVSNDTMETGSPYTPSPVPMCTPNLDGPASFEKERPPGMKKEKINNQRQRRVKQYAESEASASQSFTASLANLESSSTANWEKQLEENRRKNMMDEEMFLDMKREQAEMKRLQTEMAIDAKQKSDLEHVMKVWNDRTTIVKNRADMSKQIIAAYKMLDEIGDPRILVTFGQKKEYEYQIKTIQELEEQYAGLGEMLSVSKLASPTKTQKKDYVESAGSSQRRLFEEIP